VTIAVGAATGLMFACGVYPSAPQEAPTAPVTVQGAGGIPTPSANPPTLTPGPGFTPEVTQRNSAGVPLPAAAGARNVVVTYTPIPSGASHVNSVFASVVVGDNYFSPDEVYLTVGSTVEWRYDGAGGETESIHNVIALDKAFNSGDLNPGTRFAFAFLQAGEFAYVCSYHARETTGKIIVQ
jgi:plastocyanin